MNGEVVIKRVAAVPGDTIALSHGVVWCDGHVAADPIPSCYHDDADFAPTRLAAGRYFLLGDHRRISVDSREFGPVDHDAILGRVILRVPQQGSKVLAGARAHY